MNRRGFMGAVGAVAGASVLPKTEALQTVMVTGDAHFAEWTSRAFIVHEGADGALAMYSAIAESLDVSCGFPSTGEAPLLPTGSIHEKHKQKKPPTR